jgi:hypothetical protein
MHWLDQWRALANRIEGLLRAGDYMMSALEIASYDPYGVIKKSLEPELDAINSELQALLETGGQAIPAEATQAAKDYLAGGWSLDNKVPKQALQVLVPIGIFRARFDYFVRDSEIEARSLVELAFEHLRRRIVVDEPYAKQWQQAFREHETWCEKLGAVHLLSHGIWAFKVQALGGATDLVCGEPIEKEIGTIQRTARTLALTEWKLVHSNSEVVSKAAEAKTQAELYASGVLQTVELKRTRYLVLVAEGDLAPPNDVFSGGITYRHIVVPVNPGNPSQTARKMTHT